VITKQKRLFSYPEPDYFNSRVLSCFMNIRLNNTLPFTLKFSSWLFSFMFSHRNEMSSCHPTRTFRMPNPSHSFLYILPKYSLRSTDGATADLEYSAVPSKLYRVGRTFLCWNIFLAHNLNKKLNCNKYKLGEIIVTCKLLP